MDEDDGFGVTHTASKAGPDGAGKMESLRDSKTHTEIKQVTLNQFVETG